MKGQEMICEEVIHEEGSPCPEVGCVGKLVAAESKNCSCHINPPCSSCVGAGYECPECGWENSEYEEPEYEPVTSPRHTAGSRQDQWTRTHTANPYNSTPFTDCCGIAAINEERCPNCKALITGHDDGLAELRRKVGPGNCLMCGKPRGNIAIPGNCCC